MLDNLRRPESSLQRLLYPLESVPKIEREPFSDFCVLPEECLPIEGVRVQGQWQNYTHVLRQVLNGAEVPPPSNEPHRGRDKFIFFNRDVNGVFYKQSVYSTALFLSDDYQIFTS